MGIGADLYAVQTFVPVVLSVRGDFTSKGSKKIPFYFLEGGYGFNATSNDVDSVRFGGGATLQPAAPFRLRKRMPTKAPASFATCYK
ncbi:hypothetical protein LZG74_25900 [Dyadobacter sp. CY327]|uniref:hypothetical protein n=1 Tax=Dyadobacter sp. CY327 TaxID=2907301 RepID=UPI001F2E1505|nr:hypothetical protein [Dyadobacter sp. CY327]MCE7073768.1 hypothetical protein [Dyadobacter sp. CY327]